MLSFPNAACEFIESPQNHKMEMLNVDGMILQAKRLLFFCRRDCGSKAAGGQLAAFRNEPVSFSAHFCDTLS